MEPRRSAVAQVVDNLPMHFFKDLSLSAFTAGFVAVLVGFTSSVAIVFQAALALVPDLAVSPIESSCCGMAGSFGYEAAHYDVSMKMAEQSLLPAIRKAGVKLD